MADVDSTGSHVPFGADALLARSVPWQVGASGVYFLIAADRIRYVGKSVNIAARLREHERKGKRFDRYSVIECADPEMSLLEVLYIHHLRPDWNAGIGLYAMHNRFDPTIEELRAVARRRT